MTLFGLAPSQSAATLAAIDRSQATIEFSPDGEILGANQNFLKAVGYTLAEIKGKHHSLFVEPAARSAPEYRAFWDALKRGEFQAGPFKRVAKDGSVVWLQASYNPVIGSGGKVVKVIKFASDITAQKRRDAELAGRMAALDRVQAVIKFDLDGTILDANQNFLDVLGYRLDEIKGKHHSLFIDASERESAAYRQFWDKLRKGEFDRAQYRRIGKGGREVFIQASYNPILDEGGRPTKVVKFATDVTAQVRQSRMIEDVVRQTVAIVDAAKRNDLTMAVDTNGVTGEILQLATGVNDLVGTLCEVIRGVRAATQATLAASAEISSGSNDLARRTEQQAASLEETAATTEELAASVKTSAQSARTAVDYADGARQVAQEGGTIVGDAITAMSRIEQASSRIGDITNVIEEIAFQTNLLALNAAVEAARAGDAGKGFAVVAAEVRTLAQRSSEAAKDIGGLIGSSAAEVGQGVKLVRSAGETLGRIVEASEKVASTVSEISTATAEQANGIDEMSQVVAHMDEMTQQNAALAEQSSASATALSEQIHQLNELVSRFRIAEESVGRAATPRTGCARSRPLPWPGRPAPPAADGSPAAGRPGRGPVRVGDRDARPQGRGPQSGRRRSRSSGASTETGNLGSPVARSKNG